jgi:CTD kinase subunit gamma
LYGLQKEGVLEVSTVNELEELLAERQLPVGDDLLTEENLSKLSKRETEQRIEEDRERHKRLRESIWAVSAKDLAEWQAIVDDCSEINSDDGREAGEETGERDDAEQFA